MSSVIAVPAIGAARRRNRQGQGQRQPPPPPPPQQGPPKDNQARKRPAERPVYEISIVVFKDDASDEYLTESEFKTLSTYLEGKVATAAPRGDFWFPTIDIAPYLFTESKFNFTEDRSADFVAPVLDTYPELNIKWQRIGKTYPLSVVIPPVWSKKGDTAIISLITRYNPWLAPGYLAIKRREAPDNFQGQFMHMAADETGFFKLRDHGNKLRIHSGK